MRSIQETSHEVRAECDSCGAEQTLRRFVSRPAVGGERVEPAVGQWIQCRVCGDWSPFERGDRAPALA
ncbi:MAG: hypothetical protein JW895_04670 [Thermoleophilaceae bacterium]|nr:hypothetical protein [Thermoleophilaceae bacterium]